MESFRQQEKGDRRMAVINRLAFVSAFLLFSACFFSFRETDYHNYGTIPTPCAKYTRNDSIFCINHKDTIFINLKLKQDASEQQLHIRTE